MKAFELVAYDVDGARYCLDCAHKAGINVNEDKPASEFGGPVCRRDLDPDDTTYCTKCGSPISRKGPTP